MKKERIIYKVLLILFAVLIITIVALTAGGPSREAVDVGVGEISDPVTSAPAQVVTQAPTQTTTSAPVITEVQTTSAAVTVTETTVSAPETTETQAENKLPSTPEEILRKYTELLDNAKSSSPAFSKVEYQNIPSDKINLEGGVIEKLLPVAANFMVSEEDARANPEKFVKGGDTYWFPVYRTEKGCLLTDTSKIKSAKCTETDDGNVKITIVLNDELNSEPAAEGATSGPSAVGSMFAPIARAEVDYTLENDFAVKLVIREVDFDLKYYDCTAELVYNPTDNQIVSLDQCMHILITINSGKVVGTNVTGSVALDNYMSVYDFEY